MSEVTRWEYRIEKMRMPADFRSDHDWDGFGRDHFVVLEIIGREGWEWFQTIGPLFYFKRPMTDSLKPSEITLGAAEETMQALRGPRRGDS